MGFIDLFPPDRVLLGNEVPLEQLEALDYPEEGVILDHLDLQGRKEHRYVQGTVLPLMINFRNRHSQLN